MTKKPFINSLLATLYIIILVFVMDYATRITGHSNNQIIAPIAVISLFTLSTAVMAYLFCYWPFQLYFDGHKKSAISLFLQTVGYFSIFTLISILFLLIWK